MSNRLKRKGRAKFLMVEGFVFTSKAFRSLSTVERAAYLELKWRYDGFNNGRIVLSCRELAEALNVSKETASRAIRALCAKNFVEPVKQSTFNLKTKTATEWRLAEYKCDVTGELPSKQFMRWPEKNTVSSQGQTVSPEGQPAQKMGGIRA
ncbi:winged helix-turn-helix transcriptional regulator [Rhizobium glycinendophyticum]|uniref:Winged helix-turn-helix transcriptional regulator n=1 Tax=Rhizobium glycinendophyticum TaxID=2589807 RepID=A0A504UJH9_9HYPH|nr:winged helix-turn-helix transcriptional regulator [Rhizobium glycinendophyticum]TPP07031.1 winged helix-turn-helix transcriptional regulator [Rhizobium glycinendophyticum]